jgi:protein translocase SEC61 complex gamma subunit
MYKAKQKRYVPHSQSQAILATLLCALLERLTIAEFIDISRAVGVGFLVMGFIGFAVKLIHIPINNILVSLLLELD